MNESSSRRPLPWIVVAIVASALIVGGLLVVRSGDNDDSSAPPTSSEVTSSPDTTTADTEPATTEAAPTTAVATTDLATTVAPGPPPETLADWSARQAAAGRTTSYVFGGDGTSARMLQANAPDAYDYDETAVLLADGTLAPLPADGWQDGIVDLRLVGLGDGVAVVRRTATSVTLWVLDPATLQWVPGPGLGLDDIAEQSFPWIGNVAGSVVIGSSLWKDRGDGFYEPTDRRGVIVTPALTVTAIAEPPAGIPMEWTVVSGTKALLLGIDDAAGEQDPLVQPWSYDTVTNAWTAVPLPGWLSCSEPCRWPAPHEFGDVQLEASTPFGIVKLVPDGSIGLYDADAASWRQLQPAPLSLAGPTSLMLDGTHLGVFPVAPFDAPEQFGTIATLDIVGGTWEAHQLVAPGAYDPSSAYWDVRPDTNVVLAAAGDRMGTPLPATQFSFERATSMWRSSTAEDAITWQRLTEGQMPTADLTSLVG